MKPHRATSLALLALSLALTIAASSVGQDSVDEPLPLSGPYFGQPAPGLEAEVFAPQIISIPGRYEFALSFAPGGERLLFTVQTTSGVVQVLQSQVHAGYWSRPEPVSLAAGARKDEMEAFFSRDGRSVFFAPYDEGLDVRIWQVDIDEENWADPSPLTGPIAEAAAFFPTSAASGALYYTNIAERKPYRAHRDSNGNWQVTALDIAFGGHTFVAEDESFVLVDARSEDSRGAGDIYVAFATPEGGWTTPINLGDGVNSEFSESCPSLSDDSEYLFFSRYDEPGGIAQIYWVDSDVIEAARRLQLSQEKAPSDR